MASRRAVQTLSIVAIFTATTVRAQQPPPPPPGPASAADAAHRDSLPAVLIGRVTDSAGVGLAGAEITLMHSDKLRSITSDSGQFRIAGLPAGANVFNVRRLGFEPASFTAVLKSGKTHRATFALTVTAHALPTVAVSDTVIHTHWLDMFERRRSTARGVFFTRDEIVRKGARTGTDIVRSVAGVRLVAMRGGVGNQVVMTRGSGARPCIPSMFVHNMPYSGTLDDFSADDIEAIEVYVGVSEIPAELDKNGRGICGVIVVWTRDPKKML